MSFLTCEAKSRVGKENKLIRLGKIIDWEKTGKKLKGIHAREINGKGGQKPYDSLKMFKAVLLGQWHSLSDPGLEGEVPDETTLCRFRNKLVELRIYEQLLKEING
ncbi:MAG: hypothetical protein KKF54_01205 [Candidatus Omnitrophica bacterium]|nr:hypothetical protein [Candidatus Omnitrophota bacterium]